MSRFRTYLAERGLAVGADDIFPDHEKPLGDVDREDDTEGLMKVLRGVVEDHYGEVMAFLSGLAAKDPKVQDGLGGLSRDKLNKPPRPSRRGAVPVPGGRAEVVPNDADRAAPHEFGPA